MAPPSLSQPFTKEIFVWDSRMNVVPLFDISIQLQFVVLRSLSGYLPGTARATREKKTGQTLQKVSTTTGLSAFIADIALSLNSNHAMGLLIMQDIYLLSNKCMLSSLVKLRYQVPGLLHTICRTNVTLSVQLRTFLSSFHSNFAPSCNRNID
jgi:hypothetical protein